MEKDFLWQDEGCIWVTMAVFFLTVHVEKGIQDEKDLKHI